MPRNGSARRSANPDASPAPAAFERYENWVHMFATVYVGSFAHGKDRRGADLGHWLTAADVAHVALP